jgi:hypothetical protein
MLSKVNSKNEINLEDKLIIKKNKSGKIKIIDSGLFNKKQSVEKFVEFELKPLILKNFGTIKIEKLKILKPGIRSFRGAISCCKFFSLRKVFVPIFDAKLTKLGWKLFFELKEVAQENRSSLIRHKI